MESGHRGSDVARPATRGDSNRTVDRDGVETRRNPARRYELRTSPRLHGHPPKPQDVRGSRRLDDGRHQGANTPRESARFPAHGSPRRRVGARGSLWRAPPRGVGTVSPDGSVSSGGAGLWGERPESGGALRGPRAEVARREEALGAAATRSHTTPTSICSEPSRFLSREAIPSCAEDVRFVAMRRAGFTGTWRASRGRFDPAISGWSARWTSTLAARRAG
jgi:hypothetical protein